MIEHENNKQHRQLLINFGETTPISERLDTQLKKYSLLLIV